MPAGQTASSSFRFSLRRWAERAGVVSERGRRQEPVGARLHFLRARRGQRRLGGEHVEDAAHALLVTTLRHLRALLGAGEQVAGGADALHRGAHALVAGPDGEDGLLLDALAARRGPLGLLGRLGSVVAVLEAVEER